MFKKKRKKKRDAQYCLARPAIFCSPHIETGRHCHSHLLSDRCGAGNPLWKAAACYKWADTLRDAAKAKNFTISSDACTADRKMRMTPPRYFSLSPCDARSRCTSRVCTTCRLTVTGSLLHALNAPDLLIRTEMCAQMYRTCMSYLCS